MLYQLSYFRIISTTVHHFPDCECKGSPFFETTKTIGYLFLKKVIFLSEGILPFQGTPALFPVGRSWK